MICVALALCICKSLCSMISIGDIAAMLDFAVAYCKLHMHSIIWYFLYFGYGFSFITHTRIFRGKKQDAFYQSTFFLIVLKLYTFGVIWLPIRFISAEAAAVFLLYLPFYLDLSEITGSRISETLRNSWLAHFVNDFFNTQLVKTVEIEDTSRPYIIAVHHHGILPFGGVAAIGTEARGFAKLFPALAQRVIVAASFVFVIPIFRDLCLMASVVDCSRWSFDAWLRRGVNVAVFPGGAREATHADPDREWLDLRRKRGFLRLALRHDIAIVPVYAFNETQHYKQLTRDESQRRFPAFFYLQEVVHEATGVMLPVVYHLLPQRRAPVVLVVGEPIRHPRASTSTSTTADPCAYEPSEEEVSAFMDRYERHLTQLYEKHAPKYNSEKRVLTIT